MRSTLKLWGVWWSLLISGCQVAQLPIPVSGDSSAALSRTVIAQLFEWRWSDIATECEVWLGPKGYGAVQISPAHEHRLIDEGDRPFPWYQRYQPVSYRLESRSGSRSELADMVERCHRVGVKVYADIVINHMAGSGAGAGKGIAGSDFDTDKFAYEAVPYEQADFNPPCSIRPQDYGDNPWRIRYCQLLKLQDLDTGRESVQAAIAAAMNDLLSLGVAGFRIDAAKHIPPEHLMAIARRLNSLNPSFYPNGGRPFIYQEVFQELASTDGEAIKASEYFSTGAVTEFRYGRNLGEQMRYGQLKNLVLFGEAWGLIPSHKAVVFIDNHDTQRSENSNIVTFYRPDDGGSTYRLANIFMLAWPYGTPRVMSSYDWPRQLGSWVGPPADKQGLTRPAACGDGWVCEHRWSEVANMVEFRNATQTATGVTHWWDNSNNQIGFGRGDRGYVVINHESVPLAESLATGLPPGSYCDIISLTQETLDEEPQCDSEAITVDEDGIAYFEVPPHQAAAIHVERRLE